MTYQEKLLDPRWQKKRLEIFERDEWTCQVCHRKDKELHVHHLAYEQGREPWEYPGDQLVTTCADCHEQAHVLFAEPEFKKQYRLLLIAVRCLAKQCSARQLERLHRAVMFKGVAHDQLFSLKGEK